MNVDYVALGKNIRKYRRMADLTQEQLARMTGLYRPAASAKSKTLTANPARYEAICNISNVLTGCAGASAPRPRKMFGAAFGELFPALKASYLNVSRSANPGIMPARSEWVQRHTGKIRCSRLETSSCIFIYTLSIVFERRSCYTQLCLLWRLLEGGDSHVNRLHN